MENPIKMDDLGVPLFSETSISWQLADQASEQHIFLFFFCLGLMVIIATKATAIAVFLEGTCQKTAVNKKMVGMARP